MNKMDERMIKFVKKHHVLTLATSVENNPYCCNCFYAYFPDENWLILTSDKSTKHINDVVKHNFVAGSIVLETRIIGKIQGLQFNGYMFEAEGEALEKCNRIYLNRFPFARLIETHLWYIDLTFLKLTDNTLGFGKKIIWKKNDALD